MPTQRPRRPSQPGDRPGNRLTITIPIPGSLLLLVAGAVAGALVTGALTLSLDRGHPIAETRSQQPATPGSTAAAGEQQPGAQQPAAAQPPAGDDGAGAAGPPAASAPAGPPAAPPVVVSWSVAPPAPSSQPAEPAPAQPLAAAPADRDESKRPDRHHVRREDRAQQLEERADQLQHRIERLEDHVGRRDSGDRERPAKPATPVVAEQLERRADQLQRQAERLQDQAGRHDRDDHERAATPATPVLARKPVPLASSTDRGRRAASLASPSVSQPLQSAAGPGVHPAKHAGHARRSYR